jgi:hypothetical protein
MCHQGAGVSVAIAASYFKQTVSIASKPIAGQITSANLIDRQKKKNPDFESGFFQRIQQSSNNA